MKNYIEVEHLVKNYKNVEAVKDISFSVEEGAFFAFLGINGAGKSTTINILCTVLEKTSGNVKIGGYDLDRDADRIKDLIGIVFQNTVLDKQLTVKENLVSRAAYYGLPRAEVEKRISELEKTFDLREIMNRQYEKLSGGQKRRVDIARALINRPRLLFLDEPTTGLDPMTRSVVWNAVHKLREETGLTVFLTTHYMEETELCDRVVILDSGKIVANDTPHKLKERFAGNRLVWYTRQCETAEKLLIDNGLSWNYHLDNYRIDIDKTEIATKLIRSYDAINDYEFIKGNMDDVFLNVTGKRLGD
ncbi:MAG: ABC transporter ATP-binding protein [Oscillospiraceae bacterium]|nr:ABC transporter ATP-binding protein [Oscillospiraceae bacterium]